MADTSDNSKEMLCPTVYHTLMLSLIWFRDELWIAYWIEICISYHVLSLQLYRTTFWTRHRNDPPPDLEETLGAKHSQINIAYTASEHDIRLSVNGDKDPQVFTVHPGEQRKVFRDPDLDKQESASGI